MHIIKSVEDAKVLEGQEVGVSEWVIVDQERIDKFAEATGDFQWIHVDRDRAAAELPNGKTIAHGYLTLALIPALSAEFVQFGNLARAINFGCNKLRFYTMVPVGSRVRARATVMQARKRGGALHLVSEVKIEVEGEKKPACIACIFSQKLHSRRPSVTAEFVQRVCNHPGRNEYGSVSISLL